MRFKIKKTEIQVHEFGAMIFNFQRLNHGKLPEIILLSVNNTKHLVESNRTLFSTNIKPPYQVLGVIIIRCLDIEEDIVELF